MRRCDLKKHRVLARLACVALAVALAGMGSTVRSDGPGEPDAFSALAEQNALNLKVFRTAITTLDNSLPLTTTATNAFTPLALTCPARPAAGCTIAVIVSSQFSNLDPGTAAQVNVTIVGTGGPVLPTTLVNVDSNSSPAPTSSAHTFQWIKKDIPAGSAQTVNVQFQVNGGAANAGFRSRTVVLYKN